MKSKYLKAHMATAFEYAKLSHCQRRKVGCVFVKDDRIISIGYNGSPPGWDNVCEDENNNTKPEIIHAEANAIAKLAKTTESGEGSTVFITLAPCLNCAKQLAAMDVAEVYYGEKYRNTDGVEHLHKRGIPTYYIETNNDNNNKENKECHYCQRIRRTWKRRIIKVLSWVMKKL